ncbi:uncharacterized protein PITG_18218 [Phytophthora infestans T30-4]|uniref:Uncharacterized protein n=1 Tax=Phytophthora infestans (strain T30-4) TaxID=403677 RepID=D0NXM5_PHYIT|nr:uncharacterized protein PITG_18218 [Phytophthora infestans T30-4]EEY67825.1 hypothetical protein PITG_18218 [Phytophthora infestans T30-4]|eukprot:XP_002997850.1 hypothetical protein PITG_18218 [Phytophthora infestans T30-4]
MATRYIFRAWAGVIFVLNASNIRSMTYCNVGSWFHHVSTCLLSTFTSSDHAKPHADCPSATCRSNRLPQSRKPESIPTYSSLPSNGRIASFIWRASAYWSAQS